MNAASFNFKIGRGLRREIDEYLEYGRRSYGIEMEASEAAEGMVRCFLETNEEFNA